MPKLTIHFSADDQGLFDRVKAEKNTGKTMIRALKQYYESDIYHDNFSDFEESVMIKLNMLLDSMDKIERKVKD